MYMLIKFLFVTILEIFGAQPMSSGQQSNIIAMSHFFPSARHMTNKELHIHANNSFANVDYATKKVS
uniref:Uncharacterized protein n=1 Tax=Arundo donax TaxID=35708 RepID=A0A0A9U0J1_ARUDO